MLRFVTDDRRRYYFFDQIEIQRQQLLNDESVIQREDYGAGSKKTRTNTRIKDIARVSLSTPKQCAFLFRMVQYVQPKRILELGTSLGISTAYFANNKKTYIDTIEGDKMILDKARMNWKKLNIQNIHSHCGTFRSIIPKLLADNTYDFIYIDGNHTYESTLEYIQLMLEQMSENIIIILDDIHWSQGMHRAWREIGNMETWDVCIDLYTIGILIIHPRFNEKYSFSYIDYKFKPWQLGIWK